MAKIVVVHLNTEIQEFNLGDNDKVSWIVLHNNKGEMVKFFPQKTEKEQKEIGQKEHDQSVALRKQSYANAEKIINRCQVDELTYILNDLWDYNAKIWIDNPSNHGTIGYETIMEVGFTANQQRWIEHMFHILQGDE